MNKPLIRKWIKALRSGRYKQATEGLIRECMPGESGPVTGYCCLGVLAKVCGVKSKNFESIDHKGILSKEFIKSNKLNITTTRQKKLARMNDCDGYIFKEIADYIEKNILKEKA